MGRPSSHFGATTARWCWPSAQSRLWIAVAATLLLLNASLVVGDLLGDANALTTFKTAVDRGNVLQWSSPGNVCQWKGIECSTGNSPPRVIAVRLPGTGLFGPIPVGSLGVLNELRVLSLRSNKFSGNLPADLANCTLLRSLYLQKNNFSGSLPFNFSVWPRLGLVDLSSNNFSGSIPLSINNLTRLKSLFLQNNSFSGPIPALNISTLSKFSVANNQLNGSIPNTPTLRSFTKDAFAGNVHLCGLPLALCPGTQAPAPSPAQVTVTTSNQERKHSRKLSGGAIAGIVIGAAALLLFLCAICLVACRGRKKREPAVRELKNGERSIDIGSGEALPKSEYAAAAAAAAAQDPERNKLVFFENKKYAFDLEDLLRASAEVLGKGSVGTAYKAVLEDGSIAAVKRLKDVVIERKDFEQQISAIGKLQHENLVPLIAYYFSKDEKLLVYEYLPNGSLSALLHGNKSASRTPLDWQTRVQIALGASRGIDFLHDHRSTHGNIKSSNILLSRDYNACVSDYGLAQLVSATPAANRIVGYRAPEVTDIKRVTPKADVYSFGVLLLELLTGKAPSQASMSDDGIDLPRWVQSVVREEWTAEVFDLELMRYQDIEEEMVQMLQVAMACVATSPDQRPTMKQVVKMVEDLKKNAGDEAAKHPTFSSEAADLAKDKASPS